MASLQWTLVGTLIFQRVVQLLPASLYFVNALVYEIARVVYWSLGVLRMNSSTNNARRLEERLRSKGMKREKKKTDP